VQAVGGASSWRDNRARGYDENMTNLRPVTVVTGASAGIGVALARVFAQRGHELALIARREDKLHALADEIAATGARRPIVIGVDLLKTGVARLIGEALAAQGAEPQFVINNAGFGLVGMASARDRNEQLQMIDLNVRVLTELSLAFVDSLARHRGGLLNVGSMAGFLPGPGMAVYYATKAYVLSFTEALHSELKPLGVRVAVLCPGPVPTEFAERAGLTRGMVPGILTQSADYVAEAGFRGLMDGHRTIVPGVINKLVTLLIRIIPRRVVLWVVDRRQTRRRSAQPT